MLVRASADNLLHVGLDEVLFQKYAEIKPVYAELFDIRSSNRKFEQITGFSGFGSLANKTEGSPLTYDDPYQGYQTTFNHNTYGLGFRTTMEMQNDDLYDVIKRMPSALAETVVRYKDTQCANILNNGFTGTGSTWMTGMDGQALFSASHPLTGGGTYQNILSTAADLSVTSLETALYTFRLTVGDRNELLDLNPRYLIIPPQLERTAYELVKSSGRPDTANRADNWLNTQNLVILVWHRLSSSTAWYLASEKSQHNLVYYNRMELETDSDRDFNTKDFLYSVVTRFSVGWPDWRGVFGTPGV